MAADTTPRGRRAPRWHRPREATTRTPRFAAVAWLAGIACFAGCGGSGDERRADERALRNAFGELRRAYLTESYAAVCARMTAAARHEVGQLGHEKPTTCPRDLKSNLSAAAVSPRDRVDPEIEAIDFDGDRAAVLARLGGTTPGTVHFAKEDDEWKLDQLFNTTARPPPDLQ